MILEQKRKWLVLSSVAMGVFLATIDGSIVNVSLPILEQSLHTTFATVEWVVLSYMLTVTTLMLSIGRLADIFGKKWIYTSGFIIFTCGSVACGLSNTIHQLIIFRIIQAVGASMMMALGTAIVTEAFPPEERGRALGIMGTIVSVGVIAGPTVGGIILQHLNWHWIFFVNIPVGIIGLAMVVKNVPAQIPTAGQKFDFLGGITLFVSLISFLLALSIGQLKGFLNYSVTILLITWVAFLGAFIIIQYKSSSPMIDMALFKNRLFSVNLITGFLTFIASAGLLLLMPFYLANVLNQSPQSVGLLMAVTPVMIGVIAPIAGVLSDRWGTRPIIVVGLAILFMGYLAVSTISENTTNLGYILRFLPVGIGVGFFQAPNNSAIMGSAPRNRLGIASGMLALTRTLGQTTGIALLGAVWASKVSRYANSLDISHAPPLIQVASLRETIILVCILVFLSLLLAVWAWLSEKDKKKSSGYPEDHPAFSH
jgi:EmrB/QacA subfamily drug resistance transporter